MSVAAARPSAANPDVSDLLTRARAIGALARERAQQTEADRRVGDDMIERMRQAELLGIMQPRRAGTWLRRVRAGRCRHCERVRLDRLGLRPARLAPVAHRLLLESGAGRGLAGAHRARRWDLCAGRPGGG